MGGVAIHPRIHLISKSIRVQCMTFVNLSTLKLVSSMLYAWLLRVANTPYSL